MLSDVEDNEQRIKIFQKLLDKGRAQKCCTVCTRPFKGAEEAVFEKIASLFPNVNGSLAEQSYSVEVR